MALEDLRSVDPIRKTHASTSDGKNRPVNFSFKYGTDYVIGSVNGRGKILNRSSIPLLKVTEIQPDFLFEWERELTRFIERGKLAINVGKTVVDASGKIVEAGSSWMKKESDKSGVNIRQSTKKRISAFTSELLADPDGLEGAVYGAPLERNENMFTEPTRIGYYEIPYSGNYGLNVNGNNGWSIEDGEGETIVEKLTNLIKVGVPLDTVTIPEWKNTDVSHPDSITTEFNLYNENYDALVKNFKFIHTLAGGAYWMKIGSYVKSPNVYEIEYPGRFEYLYCTMAMEVEESGGRRRLYRSGENDMMAKFNGDLGGLNLPYDTMFPDSYIVKLSFKSLVPDSLNIYLAYLKHGTTRPMRKNESQSNQGS